MGRDTMSAEVRARLERLIAEAAPPIPPAPPDNPEGAPTAPVEPAVRTGAIRAPGQPLRGLDVGATAELTGPDGRDHLRGSSDSADLPFARRAVADAEPIRRFDRVHVLVLVLIVVVGLVITGGWLIRSREVATVEVTTSSPSTAGTPGSSAPETPTPTPQSVRVHVIGAVAKPGVVSLPAQSRVADAIEAAGGLNDDARPQDLNFAAVVPDGAQIWVGDEADPGGELRTQQAGSSTDPGAAPSDGKLNLNTATAAQFEELPGVGPVTAGNIIGWRDEHGRFERVEQLQQVPGIGPKTYQKLAPLLTV